MFKETQTGLFDSLDGILNGHSKSTLAPSSNYPATSTEKAVARMGVKGHNYDWKDVVGIGFGIEESDGTQLLNAAYMTERGVCEHYDLSLKQGYLAFDQKFKGLVMPLNQLIDKGIIKQVLAGTINSERKVYNLSSAESDARIFVLYVRKETTTKKEEPSTYYFARVQQN